MVVEAGAVVEAGSASSAAGRGTGRAIVMAATAAAEAGEVAEKGTRSHSQAGEAAEEGTHSHSQAGEVAEEGTHGLHGRGGNTNWRGSEAGTPAAAAAHRAGVSRDSCND